MILKKMKRKSFKKPKAVMIGDLLDYILALEDDKGMAKTVWAGARNFLARTPGGRKAEMVSLASESVRSKMPVTHWTLSWQENEQPSQEQIEEAVDMFLEHMGLEGHQVVYALHGNTANLHLHIAVNRTHPVTHKVIQPHKGFDIEEAHKMVALLEHRQGWASEEGARYRVEGDEEIIRNFRKSRVKPKPKAEDFENATGEKSAQRIAQERGHDIIKSAVSWEELHRKLAEKGLRFEKKGSGAVLFVGDIAVKASSIDRSFGMVKLCKRLGDFEPGDYAPDMKTPEPEPVSEIANDEWREYRELRAHETIRKRVAKAEAAAVLDRVKARHAPARHVALSSLAQHGLPVLNIARHCLKAQQGEELRRLREDMPKLGAPLPRFRTWLAERNPRLAVLLKYHRRIPSGMKAEKPAFPKTSGLQSPYNAYREVLNKRYPQPMNDSRRDAMIALWMRVTGYSQVETAEELYHKARPQRKARERRNWITYGRRMIRYVYGVAGDIDIATFKPTQEKILAFQQEVEKLEAARQAAEREQAAEQKHEEKAPQQAPSLRMR